MIHFPRLRTARIDVQLRELTSLEAIGLASLPIGRHEVATSAMLRHIVDEAAGDHQDPALWTVQERMLVMTHFLACMRRDDQNFEIGDSGARLTDYLLAELDSGPDRVEIGEFCGSAWTMRQVLGCEAEAVEAVSKSRFDWLAADMAARLRIVGDAEDDAAPDARASPAKYLDWLAARKAVFQAMPQSEFSELLTGYEFGLGQLEHLFSVATDDNGYVALNVKGGGAGAVPARFSVDSALCDFAHAMGARPAEPGRADGQAG
jgi:hypothetical protein